VSIEQQFSEIRKLFKGRAHCFRNQPRTNLLLQLIQLQRNGAALSRTYTKLISELLRANGGHSPTRRRLMQEHGGYHSLGARKKGSTARRRTR
jgi:hypothetical protein